jgi:hypothetical protein
VLDATLPPTEAMPRDDDFRAPVVHLKKHVFTIDLVGMCTIRSFASAECATMPVL